MGGAEGEEAERTGVGGGEGEETGVRGGGGRTEEGVETCEEGEGEVVVDYDDWVGWWMGREMGRIVSGGEVGVLNRETYLFRPRERGSGLLRRW